MKILDIVNYFFLVIFLLCAAVQYNDPDPVRWMILYGSAGFCCILFALRKLPLYLPVATSVAAVLWIFLLLPVVWEKTIPMNEVFSMVHMFSPGVEEVREIAGLSIVAAWMVILAFKTHRFIQSSVR